MVIWYDRSGNPLPEGEMPDMSNNRVDITEVGEGVVSTVFLGLDHNFAGGEPILFETMVFGGPLGDMCQRYHTEEEALKGHLEIVALCYMAQDLASKEDSDVEEQQVDRTDHHP